MEFSRETRRPLETIDPHPRLFRFRLQPGSLFLDALPGALHVLHGSVGLAHTEAKHKLIAQPGVGQIKIATLIETVHQMLVFSSLPR